MLGPLIFLNSHETSNAVQLKHETLSLPQTSAASLKGCDACFHRGCMLTEPWRFPPRQLPHDAQLEEAQNEERVPRRNARDSDWTATGQMAGTFSDFDGLLKSEDFMT